MRNFFEEITSYTQGPTARLNKDIEKLFDTELSLGMTRYECRYGTLSDGHDHVGIDRYYQSLKEIWVRTMEMDRVDALAKQHEASLEIAKIWLKIASFLRFRPFLLWALAKVQMAENSLLECLVHSKTLHKNVSEFNKVRLELQDEARRRFPGGIEQAQPEIHRERAELRAKRKALGYNEHLHHVPLDPHAKAELGLKYNAPELTMYLEAENRAEVAALGGVPQYMALRDETIKKVAGKTKTKKNI